MVNNDAVNIYIAVAEKIKEGLEYTSQFGAVCPLCGQTRIRTYSSPKWKDGVKIRYHRCSNDSCLLNIFNLSVKSIEIAEN